MPRPGEAASMVPTKRKASHRRTVLRLSDLDHSKSVVLNTPNVTRVSADVCVRH